MTATLLCIKAITPCALTTFVGVYIVRFQPAGDSPIHLSEILRAPANEDVAVVAVAAAAALD